MEPDRVLWPYLMVFDAPETSRPSTASAPGVNVREVFITITGMLRLPGTGDKQTIEETMDTVAVEIETKLTQSALRAIVQIQYAYLDGTDKEVMVRETEKGLIYHAEVTLSWRIGYSTLEGVPEILL